jgi:hypothetical protein
MQPGCYHGVFLRQMLRFTLVVLLLMLPSTLQAQYVSGTVVVLEVGGDYIVIAADSLRLGPDPGEVSHSACKIAKLSDQFVFATSGISGHPSVAKTPGSVTWNVYDIATQEYAVLANEHTAHLIQKLAAAYGERLADRINKDLKLEPEGPLRAYLAKHGVGTAVFAGFDEEHHRVILEVRVGIQSPGATVVEYATRLLTAGDETTEAMVFGDSAIAGELNEGKTDRSRSWQSAMSLQLRGQGLKDRLLFKAEYVADLTARYDPNQVGGPIDVIHVTRNGGVTWVRRKSACTLKEHAGASGR